MDQDRLFGGSDGSRVVTIGGKDERPSSEHLRERQRRATPTCTRHDRFEDAPSLIRSAEAQEGLCLECHDRLPAHRYESSESRFCHDRDEALVRSARVAKREVEHRQGHSRSGPHQGFGRDPIVQLDRRSKPVCRVGVATPDGKVEADDREVLVVGAFTRLEEPGLRVVRDPLRAVPRTRIELDRRQRDEEPRQTRPVASRPRALDQPFESLTSFVCVPFPGGQAGELEVRMLERRDVGHRDCQRIGALDEATPGRPRPNIQVAV